MFGQPEWAHLPHDLLQLIFSKLGQAGGLQNILSLRLVCSSWRAAVSQYSGSATFNLGAENSLSAICHLLPCLSELDIKTLRAEVNLGALMNCSNISSLSLTKLLPPKPATSENDLLYIEYLRQQDSILGLDCAYLPASLVELCLDNVTVDPESVESLSCLQLRQMKYLWNFSTPAEVCNLLKRLPHLEDLHTGQSEHSGDMMDVHHEFAAFLGLTTLTSLTLQIGILEDPVELPLGATHIRKLELVDFVVSYPVLHELCSHLSSLTWLSLRRVEDPGFFLGPAKPRQENRLRCLHLHCPDSDFVGLAGPSLETLLYQCGSPLGDERLPRAIAKAVPRLASLTCLTLARCSLGGDFSSLRKLGLRELVLLDSSGLCWSLFGQGGFLALESLQIIETHESEPRGLLGYLERMTELERAWGVYRGLAHIVLSLPSLVRLSGQCRLFTIVMAEDLKDWLKSPVNLRIDLDSGAEELDGHEWVKPTQT